MSIKPQLTWIFPPIKQNTEPKIYSSGVWYLQWNFRSSDYYIYVWSFPSLWSESETWIVFIEISKNKVLRNRRLRNLKDPNLSTFYGVLQFINWFFYLISFHIRVSLISMCRNIILHLFLWVSFDIKFFVHLSGYVTGLISIWHILIDLYTVGLVFVFLLL